LILVDSPILSGGMKTRALGQSGILKEDGLIGNGSYVKIKFTTYGQPGNPTESDTVRLEKIGVIDQVVYNSEGSGF
jgi:hypothetical protein